VRNVVLSGYYGFGNTGDEAILAATVGALREAQPDLGINVLSRNPSETSRTYNVEAYQRMSPAEVLKALQKADLVLFGGGSLLQDVTSFRSLLYYLGIIYLSRLLGKPVMVYANGIGPIRSRLGRFLVAHALSRVEYITVRDQESFRELEKLGLSRRATVTADPAFLLSPSPAERIDGLLRKEGLYRESRIVWVALRDSGAPVWFGTGILSLLSCLRQQGYQPAFLLMQERDRKVASDLNRSLEAEGKMPLRIVGGLTPEDALGLLLKGELCLGMRLHTLILAAKALVPFMGVEVDPKIGAFCRACGCPVFPDPRVSGERDILEAFRSLVDNREKFRSNLSANLPRFESLARRNISIVLSLLRTLT